MFILLYCFFLIPQLYSHHFEVSSRLYLQIVLKVILINTFCNHLIRNYFVIYQLSIIFGSPHIINPFISYFKIYNSKNYFPIILNRLLSYFHLIICFIISNIVHLVFFVLFYHSPKRMIR